MYEKDIEVGYFIKGDAAAYLRQKYLNYVADDVKEYNSHKQKVLSLFGFDIISLKLLDDDHIKCFCESLNSDKRLTKIKQKFLKEFYHDDGYTTFHFIPKPYSSLHILLNIMLLSIDRIPTFDGYMNYIYSDPNSYCQYVYTLFIDTHIINMFSSYGIPKKLKTRLGIIYMYAPEIIYDKANFSRF